jgi:hypothetical protein
MAATVTRVGAGATEMDPYVLHTFDISGMTSDETITVTHGGPTGFKAANVSFEWRVPPDPLCVTTAYHVAASDTTTACILKVVGDDLNAGVLRVFVKFYGGKSGGISAPP